MSEVVVCRIGFLKCVYRKAISAAAAAATTAAATSVVVAVEKLNENVC